MAPGGRRRKNTRMDAAFDAMSPFGFPKALVRQTLKELLAIYTEEGWPLIEEASYRVLIDTILEKVDEEEQKRDNSLKDVDDTKRSDAGTSSGVLVPACSNPELMDSAMQTHDAPGSALQINEALDYVAQNNETGIQDNLSRAEEERDREDNSIQNYLLPAEEEKRGQEDNSIQNYLPPAEAEERGRKDNSLDQNSGKKPMDNNVNDDLNSGVENFQSPAQVIYSLKPVGTVVPIQRRRRPYHGWISSDDEEVDFVELTPTPLPEHILKLLNEKHMISGKGRRAQRKRRWDVRPEDM